MSISRRRALAGMVSLPAFLSTSQKSAAGTVLKISHQFPGGTISHGDFRDRLCRIFAQEVERRTNGELSFEVYANSSLMKINAQFSAMRKGALDFSLYPISQSAGELPACNMALMPCLVTNYEQATKWKHAAVGRAIDKILDSNGIKLLSWVWQAGGAASRRSPVTNPEDLHGVRIRGGSRLMDLMFEEAGGQVSTMPSSEIYIGMQTGALDAAVTSSTSLISFRLEELSKSLVTGRGHSYWFMLEPLCASKSVFDTLSPDHQKIILQVGAELESWGLEEAKKDDEQVANVYAAKGARIIDLTDENIARWRAIAQRSAWKEYASTSAEANALMQLAREVA